MLKKHTTLPSQYIGQNGRNLTFRRRLSKTRVAGKKKNGSRIGKCSVYDSGLGEIIRRSQNEGKKTVKSSSQFVLKGSIS